MDVLQRPELTTLFHRPADRDFDFILEQLAMADRADFSDLARVCRDPNDDKFIATAVAGEAAVIVTEDLDLLVLGEYQGISILTAKEFLDRLLDDSKLE